MNLSLSHNNNASDNVHLSTNAPPVPQAPTTPTHLGAVLNLALSATHVDHPVLLVLVAESPLAPGEAEGRAFVASRVVAQLVLIATCVSHHTCTTKIGREGLGGGGGEWRVAASSPCDNHRWLVEEKPFFVGSCFLGQRKKITQQFQR